jgi:hypothetical protein
MINEKKYLVPSIIVSLHLVLFFLGMVVWDFNFEMYQYTFFQRLEIASIFLLVISVIWVSYRSRP